MPRCLPFFTVLFTLLAGASALAQEYTEIRTLGTSNAVSKPGPQTREDLQRVFRENRADYEKVLSDANWPGDPEDIFRAIQKRRLQRSAVPSWTYVRVDGRP